MGRVATRRIWIQLLDHHRGGFVGGLDRRHRVAVAMPHVRPRLSQAEEFSVSMHDATMAGLTGMMVTGTVAQRDVFLGPGQAAGLRSVMCGCLRGEARDQDFRPRFGQGRGQPRTPSRQEVHAALASPIDPRGAG